MTDQQKPQLAPKIRLDPVLEEMVRSEMHADGAKAAVEALGVLVSRGYRIVPTLATAAGQPPPCTVAELTGLESAPPLTLPELKRMNVAQMIQLWQAWD